MKSVKLAVVAALSSFAVSAFALSPMQDSDLSAVSGQDGVTIGANLNIDVGSFVYTDTDTAATSLGGSIAFKGIEIRGAIAVEIDIINNAIAKGTLQAIGVTNAASTTLSSGATFDFLPTGDVVRIALPDVAVGVVGGVAASATPYQKVTMAGNVATASSEVRTPGQASAGGDKLVSKALKVAGAERYTNNLYFGVARMEMGNSTKSFGAMAVNDIKMQGTSALIWAH